MSNAPTISNEEAIRNLRYLVDDFLPEARWTLGGAFRFDTSLQTIARFLEDYLGVRRVAEVAGSVPCLWSLDWFVQRRPLPLQRYAELLEAYAKQTRGVVLVFDNPFITPEMLEDTYANRLVQELYDRDRVRLNAVCVASDCLAEHIRSRWPKLPLRCHHNRAVTAQGRRSASMYNKWLTQYALVDLHPADAARPSLYSGITELGKCTAVLNDACLRTCPVRREHLQLLATMRQHPYDVTLMQRRADLLARAGCEKIHPEELKQKAVCALTRNEAKALYAAGCRRFIIQAHQFRNEMTFLWDIFTCLFPPTPELSNRCALIASSAMAEFGKAQYRLSSGLGKFSFSNAE